MAQGHECVTINATGCGFDPIAEMKYLSVYFHFFVLVSWQSATLNFATLHIMPPGFGRNWGTECFNTKIPLPTQLWIQRKADLIY